MGKFGCFLLAWWLAVMPIFVPAEGFAAVPQQPAGSVTVLPEDTVLRLELLNFLESKRNKVGDSVAVKILEPVLINEIVVIPSGTVLEGTLKKVQKGRLLSQKGIIRMRLKDYYLPNGYLVKLSSEEIKFSGDMNYTSLVAGFVVPFSGLAFKGKQVNCKPGTQFKFKLAHDVSVERY